MVTKKDLIIAILVTFCLTVTLFAVIPIRSSPGSIAPYDPWLDINDDGKISMDEIVSALDAFGSTGDPTKNVNVTNWPTHVPKTYRDAVEITVFEDQVGVPFYAGYFHFAFSPKQDLINVTRITWLFIVNSTSGGGVHYYNVGINDVLLMQASYEQVGSNRAYGGTATWNPAHCDLVVPGSNYIYFDFWPTLTYIFKVTVLIEYNYES